MALGFQHAGAETVGVFTGAGQGGMAATVRALEMRHHVPSEKVIAPVRGLGIRRVVCEEQEGAETAGVVDEGLDPCNCVTRCADRGTTEGPEAGGAPAF